MQASGVIVIHAWLTAAWEICRRFGWFPIAVLLAHEFCAHILNGYRRWPHIDIPLHFFGGASMAFLAAGALAVLAKRGLTHRPDAFTRMLVLIGMTATAALIWEFAEWTADRTLGTTCQLSLDDTLSDLAIGLLGGTTFILVTLPKFLRAERLIVPFRKVPST